MYYFAWHGGHLWLVDAVLKNIDSWTKNWVLHGPRLRASEIRLATCWLTLSRSSTTRLACGSNVSSCCILFFRIRARSCYCSLIWLLWFLCGSHLWITYTSVVFAIERAVVARASGAFFVLWSAQIDVGWAKLHHRAHQVAVQAATASCRGYYSLIMVDELDTLDYYRRPNKSIWGLGRSCLCWPSDTRTTSMQLGQKRERFW